MMPKPIQLFALPAACKTCLSRCLLCGILTPLTVCLSIDKAICQEDSVITEITAHIAESLPQAEDLSELTQRLSFYQQHPIDLNHTTAAQLNELAFLSELQISNLFSYIQTSGKLKDLLELQSIAEFDLETIRRLMPFVTLKAESLYSSLKSGKPLSGGNHELLLRYAQTLEKQKGFNPLPGSRYLGSPEKLLLKYRYNFNQLLTVSVTASKDAGETFFRGSSKTGFDFLSGSISVTPKGRLKELVIGDYSLQLGQGLSLWTGLSLGKGPDVSAVAKKDTGLKPYTSTNQYSFFRGVSGQVNLIKNIDLTTFISLRSLDASLSKGTDGNSTLSAIGISGLHRTTSEIRNKGDLGLLLYGTTLTWNQPGLDIGITAYHSSYDHDFITGTPLYKTYAFTGKELTNFSSWYNYTFRNSYFFGEAAHSYPGGTAMLNGVMASLSAHLSAVLLYRNYSKRYLSFYTQALGEGSDAANEKGLYAGLHLIPSRKWDLSIYGDVFSFPWAKYRVDTASSGYEVMGQVSYSPIKTFKVTLKISTKKNEQNVSSGLPVNPVVRVVLNNYRLGVQWKLKNKFSMQNRLEVTQYKKGESAETYGYMVYQDVAYHPLSSRLNTNMRLAFFNAPVYENRVYAYEDDVLYGSGSGLYYGKGVRSFLNLNYRLSKQLRIWARYAIFLYPGRESIGSGLDEIRGNRKSEIKVQLRYQF
ncbi:helix-hairpin-helix domain-containing protein [Pedobacter sp. L105]|uniref:helix-hairpin-helix domain-containing protein n=1 Tax=Pedobacter sp. L105 TaxID=1641871 RepID=UPI0020B1237A|nr:helix-hairpin-helix domain-containing protein [Pedobacter sp. L105]